MYYKVSSFYLRGGGVILGKFYVKDVIIRYVGEVR